MYVPRSDGVHPTSTVLVQHSMAKGLKLFKEREKEAVLEEIRQLHTIKTIKPDGVPDSRRKGTGVDVLDVPKKRCGRVKGRGFTDRRRHRITSANRMQPP